MLRPIYDKQTEVKRRHMKNLLVILSLLSFFFVENAGAGTYYVDNVNGHDTASGANQTADAATGAWQTVAKVDQSAFSAGDVILFRRGGIWREQLTIPSSGSAGKPITFGAYGAGENPIISGSNLVSSGWSRDSANVWKAAVTPQPTIVYINGTRGTPVGAKSGINAEFEWYWAANVLYVWSPADDSPAENYTAPGVEVGQRDSSLKTNNKSYITIDGLTLRDGNRISYPTVVAGWSTVAGVTFQNCTIERGGGHGLALGADTTAADVTISNCVIRDNAGWGIWVDNDFAAGAIINSKIYGNGWGSARDAHQYAGIQGYLGNLNITDNTIYENVTGPTGFPSHSHGIYALVTPAVCTIRGNRIHGHTNGSGVKVVGSANVIQNVIYGNAYTGIDTGQNEGTNVVYVLSHNVVYGNNTNNTGAGINEQEKGSGTISLSLYNNTVYQNGNTGQFELRIRDNLSVLTVRNNLFFATPTRRTAGISVAQTGAVTIDNNLHWRADGNPNIIYNDNDRTWTEWKALGFDTQGINADPLFIDAAGADFQLKPLSPCIDAGSDVGLTVATDTSMNGSAPDIGAYEFNQALEGPQPPRNLLIKQP